jgi:DNA-binding transcriptional MerR regulator
MSIGEVLAALSGDFPGISHSKIRFLEDQGLVEPERTPSGYRKYSGKDMERLRYVLTVQREHYLPLKVIKEHLDAIDRGLQPPTLTATGPQVPTVISVGLPTGESMGESTSLRLTRKELQSAAELDESLLNDLEAFGLLSPKAGPTPYDRDDLAIAQVVRELAAFGLEPRHLRAFKTAAEREVGLVEQVVSVIRKSRDAGAQARADEAASEMGALSIRLHTALVKAGLRQRR